MSCGLTEKRPGSRCSECNSECTGVNWLEDMTGRAQVLICHDCGCKELLEFTPAHVRDQGAA